METKEHETVPDNMELKNGTNDVEIVTDKTKGEMLEGSIVITPADEAASAGISKDGLITGAGIVAEALLISALVMLRIRRKGKEQKQRDIPFAQEESSDMTSDREPGNGCPMPKEEIQIGKIHHIGKRSVQQDSLGVADIPEGVFAVVTDGMGGLTDGDKVSQTIVMTMLQEISDRKAQDAAGRLFSMVSHANDTVNRMLGTQSRYVSGSTVVAVLAGQGWFEWISVGDSRICLYRGGRLIQLNREHNYESELLWQAVNGEISFAEARENPKSRSLTSFIGMGKLKYIDGSIRPVEAVKGDCLLLMSDGVFNTLSDEEICAILQSCPEPLQAAEEMEKRILAYNRPKQDNFTTVILKF